MKTTLRELNAADASTFIAVSGSFFEHSPWIAERTSLRRPFATLNDLHGALCATVDFASPEERLALVRAHPDLVGRAALAGTLTRESTGEQAAAGLGNLSADEIRRFQEFNAAYQQKFDFPFVICARENKKEAILAAFPVRLQHDRAQELRTALAEVFKIARLRLFDAVSEE